jgi:hypothetical protein
MKKLLLMAFISLSLVAAFAQDKVIYDANAEVRKVPAFNAIKVSHGIELLLTHGNTEAVAVSAEEKEQRDAIKTEVTNGELRIYIEQKAMKWWKQLISKGKKPKAYVSFVKLEKIDGSSGAKITIDGSLNTAVLSFDLSSGANLRAIVKAKHLTVEQSSGGTTNISGTAENLKVNSSSGGRFNGYDLVVVKCKAEASSGGKIQLNVTNELAAYASSGGGIDYKGSGAIMDISTSSGGKVRKDR